MIALLKDPARYRWMVASRIAAAALGGYLLTSALTVLLALTWPLPQAYALAASTMLSFALYAAIIVWVFAARRLWVVWLGLILTTAVCTALCWLLLPGAVPGGTL
ncbi:hypothetical protein [Halopseudomonas pelagia]|uniref:hypothetical protein n=1 Tax=Halopseudomonas pelagia TaxID=553151 RepID=UPI0003A3ECFA|nr:hypothetical protein [Halopseudomonas pelagia]|tara:strand:- start:53604 stop:53918 length:315 start_codon:yes stop_codon:yes gene_type:complete